MGDYEFVISDGPAKGQSVVFPGPKFLVGSGPDCQLRLEASLVQPRHAEVWVDAQSQVWVRDVSGKAQVWINGETKTEGIVPEGGFVRFGRLEVAVRVSNQGARGGPSGTMAAPTPLRTAPAGDPMRVGGLDSTMRRPTPFGQPAPSAPNPMPAPALSTILPPGTIIDGRYRVVGKLAAGGMGEVYRAEHTELGKAFALKVMLPELSRDPEFVTRFKREAIAASRIGQQNIVDISDFGQTADGRFYFVMEYLDGLTLASLVHREGAQGAERSVTIILQVARALAAAHAQGIVHRDLKPENIMLLQRPGQPDFVKVLDFGVAKVATGHGTGGQTAVGIVVGTPQYMSPEQAKAVAVDARSDIYSLGLILYELLAGRPTFVGETPSMLMVKHVTEAAPPLFPGPPTSLPVELEQLVFQMLEKEVAARTQSMEQVVATLDNVGARLKTNDPSLVRTTGPVTAKATPLGSSGIAARVSGRQPAVSTTGSLDAPVELPGGLRRSPLPFVLGAMGLAVAGGLGWWAMSKGDTSPTPTAPTGVAPVVTPVAAPTPAVAPTAAPVAAAAEKTKLTLVTVPEKADVTEGDVLLGTTPLTLSRDSSAIGDFTFSLKGYKSARKKVAFVSQQTVTVELEKEKERGGGPRPGKRKPSKDLADDPYSSGEELKDNPF